jgi:hemoglobin-like flavoprotein
METSPETRALFEMVNMNRQAEMLAASLDLIAKAGAGEGSADVHVDALGQFHARLGVPARMYDQWLACLVETAAACDPAFSPEVAQAWREVLGRGIARMKGVTAPLPTGSVMEGTSTGPTFTGPTASPPERRG